MGACGCNNKGTVSMTSQLPPGCDSILSIDTNEVGTETIITITFCSGAIQQFSIPHGEDGSDGAPGGTGGSGTDGNGISDITAEQDGTEVTLIVTLNDGENITLTFNVPTASGAYIVQHLSNGSNSPEVLNEFSTLVLNDITGMFSAIRGVIPGNTIVNAGDTMHWDAVFNVTANNLSQVHDVFKLLYLCVGNNDNEDDKISNLSGNPSNITISPVKSININNSLSSLSVHVNVEMSKTNSTTRDELMVKGTMTVYDKGVSTRASHLLTDFDAPTQEVATVGIYTLTLFNKGVENYIQLIGTSGGFGDEVAIQLSPIYMTVTKIPKI